LVTAGFFGLAATRKPLLLRSECGLGFQFVGLPFETIEVKDFLRVSAHRIALPPVSLP
jgi:hypothetical protein